MRIKMTVDGVTAEVEQEVATEDIEAAAQLIRQVLLAVGYDPETVESILG